MSEPQSKEEQARRALDCLFITVDEAVAKDVNEKVRDYFNELLLNIHEARMKAERLRTINADLVQAISSLKDDAEHHRDNGEHVAFLSEVLSWVDATLANAENVKGDGK